MQLEYLGGLKKEYPKLVVVQGEWPNETVQRNDGIKIAKIMALSGF